MKSRVLAIGLDSTDLTLLDQLSVSGHIPTISRIRSESTVCRLATQVTYQNHSVDYASTEGNWVMFQTGVSPNQSGYWETVTYDPKTYRTTNDFQQAGYDYAEYPPFYALGSDYKVITFDIPVSKVVPNVSGNQIVGWGGHFPYVQRNSEPAELLEELNQLYGKNPVIYQDHGVFWSLRYAKWLVKNTQTAIEQRRNICLDLIKQKPFDLFLTVFSETHSVLHDLWADYFPQHPVHHARSGFHEAIPNFFQQVDDAIQVLESKLTADDTLILFSVHGMQDNSTDLACLFFLSEMLYRFNFPGTLGIAPGGYNSILPDPILSGLHWYWFGEIWRRKASNWRSAQTVLEKLPAWDRWVLPGSDLRFPFFTDLKGPENGWMPTVWYRNTWSKSRSFAIPAFADGHVRINLQGRESQGIVTPEEYHRECEKIAAYLLEWKNPRNDQPVVKEVIPTRNDPNDTDPKLPHADLIVVWEETPFDVMQHPEFQRIGPVPYFRTGGHKPGGFAMIKGPAANKSSSIADHNVYDLAPTILDLLGAPIPEYFQGKSLLGTLGS